MELSDILLSAEILGTYHARLQRHGKPQGYMGLIFNGFQCSCKPRIVSIHHCCGVRHFLGKLLAVYGCGISRALKMQNKQAQLCSGKCRFDVTTDAWCFFTLKSILDLLHPHFNSSLVLTTILLCVLL